MPRLRARATISALPFAIRKNVEDEIFKVYLTDALKVIGENTAGFSGEGKCMSGRYADIIRPSRKNKTENRSGDEIAADVISRIAGTARGAPLSEVKKNE